MPDPLTIVFSVLCGAWALHGWLALQQVRKYAGRLSRPRRPQYDSYRPRTALIVPCAGGDPDLGLNLRRFARQNHPDYRLIFAVESHADLAHAAARRVIADHPHRPIDLVVAGPAPPDTGQKVHNQLAAIHRLERLRWGERVWAFADADAAPGPAWLGDLVGPLYRPNNAIATGYRWLIPTPPSRAGRPTFWSKLASVLNAAAACFAGHPRLTLAWGGSMALRVDTARRGRLVDRLAGALSDDFQVSSLAHDLGRRIYFVPRCLIRSPISLDRTEFLTFVHRQYLITRVHAPGVFYGGLAVCWFYTLGLIAIVSIGLLAIVCSGGNFGVLAIAAALSLIFGHLAGALASGLRQSVAPIHGLGADSARKLRSTARFDVLARPLWIPLTALLLTHACLGRTLTWRGRRYRLNAPQRIAELP